MLRLVLLAVVIAFLGLSAWLFVWPDEDRPRRADAVVVLAGSNSRLDKGLELMRRRTAPLLVVSDGLREGWPQANRLCRRGSPRYEVLCFHPNPYSTRGEARNVGRIARVRRWRRIVLVTSTYHLTRARILFERCLDAQVIGVASGNPVVRLPEHVASEWVKLVYSETLKRSC